MKNNQLTTVLVGLLFLSTAWSIWLIYLYSNSIHKIQAMERPLYEVQMAGNIMQSIRNDTLEYNKTAKSPEINRILQALGAPPAQSPAKPAAK